MPPWWVQQHRFVEQDDTSWVCTCGAKGRSSSHSTPLARHNKHVERQKEKAVLYAKSRKGKVQHERWYDYRYNNQRQRRY